MTHARVPIILVLCRQGEVQGQPGLHSKFPPATKKEPGREAGEGTPQNTQACYKGGNRWGWCGRSWGLDLDVFLPTPALLFQVLVAGIEANIPVTYGIGSQRRDQSTGCQFIGQSPVHSISAAR